MPKITLVLALLLLALGGGLYVGTGSQSVTALIPAFFGFAFLVLGWLARSPSRLKLMMHIAAVLALLGIGGAARGFGPAIEHASGTAIDRPAAAWGQVTMALLCAVYLVLCIRSFVLIRRARAG